MAKNTTEKDFKDLIERMHSTGDLRILKLFITALRDDCKYRRQDPAVIESVQALTYANGEEFGYDNLLAIIDNLLGK